jgi:citrate synthase
MADKKLDLVDTETGKKAQLTVRSGTLGPSVVDIAPLAKDFGAFTYDPGYGATAAVESKISTLAGAPGVLLHRGYPIEQLAA